MCPRGQDLGLQDPRGQNAVALASAIKSLALEIKYYYYHFSFALSYCLHSLVNELMKVRIIMVKFNV